MSSIWLNFKPDPMPAFSKRRSICPNFWMVVSTKFLRLWGRMYVPVLLAIRFFCGIKLDCNGIGGPHLLTFVNKSIKPINSSSSKDKSDQWTNIELCLLCANWCKLECTSLSNSRWCTCDDDNLSWKHLRWWSVHQTFIINLRSGDRLDEEVNNKDYSQNDKIFKHWDWLPLWGCWERLSRMQVEVEDCFPSSKPSE